MKKLHLTECPRDAMQGIKEFIPTELKVRYLQQLLNVGFDVLDFGSFVSPKAIPQMQDTPQVLEKLDISHTSTQLLAIIANYRGAEEACKYEAIRYLGFPLSVSEEFQRRNTNASIDEAYKRIEEIQNLCINHKKEVRVYLSMAFGNPYGEEWNADKIFKMAEKLYEMGISEIALADTIGCSTPENINYLFSHLTQHLPNVHWIAHLHSTPYTAAEKIKAVLQNHCLSFDSTIMGLGGCPMAKEELTGNIATEKLIEIAQQNTIDVQINFNELKKAQIIAQEIFHYYH